MRKDDTTEILIGINTTNTDLILDVLFIYLLKKLTYLQEDVMIMVIMMIMIIMVVTINVNLVSIKKIII